MQPAQTNPYSQSPTSMMAAEQTQAQEAGVTCQDTAHQIGGDYSDGSTRSGVFQSSWWSATCFPRVINNASRRHC